MAVYDLRNTDESQLEHFATCVVMQQETIIFILKLLVL